MIEYDSILYTVTDGIARISLNRPDVMNALNTLMRAELADAFVRAGKTARVVVLSGEGKAFCSGQDLGDGKDVSKLNLERVLRDEYVPMMRALNDCPVPTICVVQGAAAGAGANLALGADVVIAGESAYFTQAFTRIGLIPDAGGTWTLPRQVGMARAMGASLFADKIDAKKAEDWGMIYECVADDGLSDHVTARATALAQGPTLAYGQLKEAMRQGASNTYEEQLFLEAKLQGACGKTRDFKEGIVSFLEKRPAKFEGR